ncbi:16S rRNA (uracil1498-N3)-methyltransferase [Faunimonas pinastri]|uniref:Ribosomal RNA small subunit methyltransferase E n=1 Tax=Faunimonas pinastri TaxID=1855383 RepID=A0A1H8ZI14_9HYPH|nr:16S rRNA (uracil(1498)-N(3))-methyltransferase [Faunimonas pinastri]SEP63923.1 16S rRNA (uracil1498-N3)-methyltransferase [Faunimonas pinastri]
MRIDFRSQRLFLDQPLAPGAAITLDKAQANYLLNVLRMAEGDRFLAFNGRDGEWRMRIAETGKRTCGLVAEERMRPQPPPGDLHYLFAPLKHARLDYMVQKAVEMGASALRPVLTQHTQVNRINSERMRANAMEAAEQCGVLALPTIEETVALEAALDDWDPARRLVFCDEDAEIVDPVEALRAVPRGPVALLIGPEGGFSEQERRMLLSKPFVVAISLGPRILRADTAAVAALAIVQAVLGDWRDGLYPAASS